MGPIYRRILLKLSGEALMGPKNFGIDIDTISQIGVEIKEIHDLGVEVAVVVGGGNIFRGVAASAAGMDRSTADAMGMLATVINALALQDAVEKNGVSTRLMTAIEMHQVAEVFIRRRAVRHLEKGRVILLAGGTGHPYFSTDTGAALRAAEIHAEAIFKATKVEGVYDSDPVSNKEAVLFKRLTYNDVLNRELKVIDATAISMCKENRIPVHVFSIKTPGNIKRILLGEALGTVIS